MQGQVDLAVSAFQNGQFQNITAAAKAYNVPRSTLVRRLNGTASRRDTTPNRTQLTSIEEEMIVKYILDLASRGNPPRKSTVEEIASSILQAQGKPPVGKNWVYRFLQRRPDLKTAWTRRIDYRRAKCEDPKLIREWFEVVKNTIAKYGIYQDDIYNFDETGFQMGTIGQAKVVTGSEGQRPKQVEGHSQEWVTVIQAIGSSGYTVPPFIIFKGQLYNSSWFEEDLLTQWRFGLSENGWTNNTLGLQYIQHFHTHTVRLTKGVKRLLILDGHSSHHSKEFERFCEDNNIITLFMPPHSSHLL